ncbi:putative acetyltransferase [Kitasatospora gansuensis]|uniref:Putative acetyltransferase n=1 Tax=Kitasatospora gansuensis TaxID=258050 RepID=A0A7W7SF13_9ACTN|nr:GNAT family N-acetyltransferase [Kitasatospora gansuensis]MBB4949270.1 putative acetyltransferase [Kitasatospora gansuensis]
MTADTETFDNLTVDGLTVRTLTGEEWDGWYRTLEVAFGGQEEHPEERALWRELTEPARSLGVWDGAAPVACAGAFSLRMTVPGGVVVPVAAVTMVGVLPTHRRRGILTGLMRRQLTELRDGGEAVAVLTASESGIYGRFGYGLGSWRMALTVPTGKVAVRTPVDRGVRLRLADPVESGPACEELYAGLVAGRPGMLERRPGWEKLPLLDPPAGRDGASPRQCVLAEDRESGRLLGYARYSVSVAWGTEDLPDGTVRVRDIEARTPEVYATLWDYLLNLDLVERVTVANRPVDDPVLHLVDDPRRLEPRLGDALHVRLVRLGEALELREYATALDVVLEVTDGFCPWNTGRWRLRSGGPGKGASCVRTDDPADLVLDVRELGAAYLGGVRLAALGRAGLVRELGDGALAEADRAFASDLAPWLPHGF